MKKILCATLENIDAKVVEVEGSLNRGLPSFSIVGLAQTSIQESKERVKSALDAIKFKFPPKKIVINLSPSDIKKEGSHFDLPIALLIALNSQEIDLGYFMFGELGLDGKLKDTNSIFPIILSLAKEKKLKKVIIPNQSVEKVSKIPSLEIIGINTLQEAIDLFKGSSCLSFDKSKSLSSDFLKIDEKRYYYSEKFEYDFIDVKAQEMAKRASLIAAAGMHNILFEGSPGSGKSMSIKRLRYILPPMSIEEILEVARLKSIDGQELDFKPIREFRSPHHTSSRASIFGGGSKLARVGEVALANSGILFFDEFPHFPKMVLESLREPLEDYKVLISRVNTKTLYETKFLFAAAMNPCPCGNLYSQINECKCNEIEIKRYKSRLSAPLLDRIEIFVKMDEINSDDLPTISSLEMFEKVKKAFIMQKLRGQSELNSKLSELEIKKFCSIDNECENLLLTVTQKFGLSHRGINNILKVARTIADLQESQNITKEHILESLSFRRRD